MNEAVDLRQWAERKYEVCLGFEGARLTEALESGIERWGDAGEVYRLRSGFEGFDWHGVLGRRVTRVQLPAEGMLMAQIKIGVHT